MLVYHFIKAEYGITALRSRRLKVARIHNLNDPFEFLAPDLSSTEARRAFLKLKDLHNRHYGLLCFSRSWRNPVMWSHYAEKHQGLCLGFDIPFQEALSVEYCDERLPLEPLFSGELEDRLKAMKTMLAAKFSHWSYEQEVRLFVNLDVSDPRDCRYYCDFTRQLELKEVVIGIESQQHRKEEIEQALLDYDAHVDVFQAKPAFKRFEVLRERL